MKRIAVPLIALVIHIIMFATVSIILLAATVYVIVTVAVWVIS